MKFALRHLARLATLLCLTVGATTAVFAATATAGTVWSDWISALRTQGLAVTQGIATAHDCDDLIEVFDECVGNNPAGLYANILVPVGNAYVDPCYNAENTCNGQNIFTKETALPGGSAATVNQFYRLSDRQALVLIVRLPPNAAYFGYQNYVWSRALDFYGKPCEPAESKKGPNPCRTLVRASVANSINHVSILAQSGLALGSGGSVAFITTSNRTLYERLASVFDQAGGDPSLLFLEPLGARITAGFHSANIVTGLDASADELNALVRYAIPEDRAAGASWLGAVGDNIQVFRVEDTDGPAAPLYTVRISPKRYTEGESELKPALDELVQRLQTWLQSTKWSTVKSAAMGAGLYTASGYPIIAPVGTICLQRESDCRRATDDTDSYRSKSIGQLKETAIIVGVDSTQTGNAHYISLGVNRGDYLMGVYSLEQTNAQAAGFLSGTLRGSASDLVASLLARGLISPPSSALVNALPKLYAAVVTRDCSSGASKFFCSKDYTVQIDAADIPDGVPIVLTTRAYIHPGDSNGANPRYLVSPVVIK